MGVASPPSLARESLPSSKLILATPSMSQGFHQGTNIYNFSDEFHQRPQQQLHLAQQQTPRTDKLMIRPLQGFFQDTTAPMEEEEEEEEVPGIYAPPPPTAILPEMFNFPGAPADLLSCQNSPPAAPAYQYRFQQRPAASFLASADSWPYAGGRQGMVMDNTSNWGSLENAGDMNPDSSTAMRLFFMNPQSSAAPREPQAARRHHQYEHHHRPPSSQPEDEPHDIGAAAAVAAAVVPLHHPDQASGHHSQAFLGAGGAAYVFGGGGGGSVMDTQGLSLSLSSSLRQFEIMSKADQDLGSVREAESGTLFFDRQLHHHVQAEQQDYHHHELLAAGHHPQIIRQGQQQQQHMAMSYGGDGGGPGPGGSMAGVMNMLRNSKYARAAQELLEEFCSVGRGGQFQFRSGNRTARASSINPNTSSGHAGGGGASTSAAAAAVSSSSSKDIPPSLSPADRFENQRKKSKLLSILEEVEKRYSHYCEQMQMVVNSFDSMMGLGAATPYTALARKAMSRHFRCLKDAVTAQLRGTCELLGEKDGAGSGSGITKGETPRLRFIDQNLRQQRAFHQIGMMEQEAWRPQRGLPDRSVNVLRAWLFEHFLHPYPSDADKHLLARQTGLSRNQVSNWFINARVRLWKPMVEDMYQQEAKEEDEEEQEDFQHSKLLEEETANSRTLASVSTQQQSKTMQQQQQQAHDQTRQQSPESHAAPENDPSSAPIPRLQPRQADDAAAIFAPALDDGIYGRAAAVLGPSSSAQLRFGSASASARGSGDLSLTLGLRHAGGNAPETGRFGL